MAKQQINQLQSMGEVYAYGDVASNIANGIKTLYPAAYSNITFNSPNAFTIQVKGYYFLHAQQLILTGASAIYFGWTVNTTAASFIKYGYIPGSTHADGIASAMYLFNVGDVVRVYQQNAATSAWEGAHSAFQIFLIKRVD